MLRGGGEGMAVLLMEGWVFVIWAAMSEGK